MMIEKVVFGLVVALVIIYSVSLINTSLLTGFVLEKIDEQTVDIRIIQLYDSSCSKCYDLGRITNHISGQRLFKVSSLHQIDLSSANSKELVDKYDLKTAPSLVITGEVSENVVQDFWKNLGGRPFDNSTIVISSPPPYRDLESGKILGIVKIIELDDKACEHCYDVNVHERILANFGVYVDEVQKSDISSQEGKDLIERYGIQTVPTVLISPEVATYGSLMEVWSQVGYVADDGWLVFNNTEVMYDFGGYKDLATGQEVAK